MDRVQSCADPNGGGPLFGGVGFFADHFVDFVEVLQCPLKEQEGRENSAIGRPRAVQNFSKVYTDRHRGKGECEQSGEIACTPLVTGISRASLLRLRAAGEGQGERIPALAVLHAREQFAGFTP